MVEITAAGIAKLSEAEETLAAVEDDVLGGLSENERETLYQLLHRATREHVLDCSSASREWAVSDGRS
jgi:DNA-binding MarR family transcriptional regulator